MSVESHFAALSEVRTVPAVFGSAKMVTDPAWEWDFAAHLKKSHTSSELLAPLVQLFLIADLLLPSLSLDHDERERRCLWFGRAIVFLVEYS